VRVTRSLISGSERSLSQTKDRASGRLNDIGDGSMYLNYLAEITRNTKELLSTRAKYMHEMQ
jgi:hypothetical protein